MKRALSDLAQGKMILLLDDESRENEGDLIMAAEKVNLASMQFMLKHTSGIVCLSMSSSHAKRLGIGLMVPDNRSKQGTPFGVSFEAATGISTGVSAADRVRSIQVAAAAAASSADIVTPGHVFPLIADDWGVLARAGHTEGSVDLMRLAGLNEMAVIAEVTLYDGSMARRSYVDTLAQQHDIAVLTVQDIINYRWQNERIVRPTEPVAMPTDDYGQLQCQVFLNPVDGKEHLIVKTAELGDAPVVRLHSECLTGDVLGSRRCDCGQQLHNALAAIAKEGGVLIYLRQEGRGIGLANKIRSYALQQQGMDTVQANEHLGFHPDCREYSVAAQICHYLGLTQIRLLTNNPDKIMKMTELGVSVLERVAIPSHCYPENANYLKTKQTKLGHLLNL